MIALQILSHVEVSNSEEELMDVGELHQLRKLGVVLRGKEAHLNHLFQGEEGVRLREELGSGELEVDDDRVRGGGGVRKTRRVLRMFLRWKTSSSASPSSSPSHTLLPNPVVTYPELTTVELLSESCPLLALREPSHVEVGDRRWSPLSGDRGESLHDAGDVNGMVYSRPGGGLPPGDGRQRGRKAVLISGEKEKGGRLYGDL